MLEIHERQLDVITEAFSRILRGDQPSPIPLAPDAPENEYTQLVSYINRFLKEYQDAGEFMLPLSMGELHHSPPKGKLRVLQSFKSLQANLRHLTWKTQRIAAGDFSQQVDFMGDFSTAFNSMTRQLQQAFSELEHANQELALLNRIGQMFSETIDLESVLLKVLNQMREQLGIPATSFWLRDLETGEMVCKESIGPGREDLLGWRLPAGEGIVGETARKGEPILVEDARRAPSHYKEIDLLTGIESRSLLCLPFRSRGEVTGVLALVDETPGRFTQNDLQRVEPIAAAAANAVENARLYMLAQQEIAERVRTEEALRQAKVAADDANQAKSAFLANMSHELRTPLNGILGYAQILQRDADATDSQRDGVQAIEHSGNHLLSLISDILDLAKIEAGKIELLPESFSLAEFLDGVSRIVGVRAEQKALIFRLECPDSLPAALFGDAQRLRQVLLNLLSNGIKFTNAGGVTLRLVDCRPSNTHATRQTAIRFEVEDSGGGILPEELDAVFEPFRQLGGASQRAGGTGLGLAISRQLVQLMGGTLQVRSTPGEGSTFWFEVSLPEAEIEEPAAARETRRILGVKGDAPLLLIVDDSPDNREILRRLLMPLGFDVIEADDGHEALTKAMDSRPRGIITDITMPEMDGLELIRRIRRIPEIEDCVIIAVSAKVYQEDRQECFAAGCDDFLSKPIRSDELFELLRRHLELEWVYKSDDQAVEQGDAASFPMVLPPPDALEALIKAALIGDIFVLREQLASLQEADSRLKPFADTLGRLVKGFQMEAIREFLKSCRS